MWPFKTPRESDVVKALVLIKKGTDKHIYKILGNSSLFEICKNAFCGTY